jgi:hypothetical protein
LKFFMYALLVFLTYLLFVVGLRGFCVAQTACLRDI